ncbi:ATP-binding protein [Kitasatospora herbaricolor]|uniref:ATP-binding protein n=1 Tax=Kitasatospora herbaricolor TaxID=68217 RepID=A0ABZ1WAJ5_9ACTN|nr:ATP-binding protein [Kitasatospora herbaricolor]
MTVSASGPTPLGQPSPTDTASFPVPQEWDVEPDRAAVRPARRLIREIAGFWGVPLSECALQDVELCAGELLANAVEHTGARCRVTVRWTGEALRVEVADTSLRPPDPSSAEDTTTGGRGLCLVAGLSRAWGWEPVGAGKVVWFEVAADRPAVGDRRLAVLVRVEQARVAGRVARSG